MVAAAEGLMRVRSKTTSVKAIARQLRDEKASGVIDLDLRLAMAEVERDRPKTRADCENVPRPCPYLACRYHLFLDVTDAGGLKLNFPEKEVWELKETCALDVAEQGGKTLEEAGALLNLTRERTRQIEDGAIEKGKQQQR